MLKYLLLLSFTSMLFVSCEKSTAPDLSTDPSLFKFNSTTGAITDFLGTNKIIVIPASIKGVAVTSISQSAFYNKQIDSITFPSSITTIGYYACANNSLTSITIPGTMTSIGEGAFSLNRLTRVTIQSGVISIGSAAFDKNKLTTLSIPSSVTSIGSWAFTSNQLTSVTIPGSVTAIGEGTFFDNNLSSVTLGANVTIVDIENELMNGETMGNNVGFKTLYDAGGKLAGTYIFTYTDPTNPSAGGSWSKQ